MSKSRDIADSAATINYIDNVTSDVQSQLNTLTTAIDNVSVTSGTLTKTFTQGESSTIDLTSSVLAPVVSVTKEVPQSGVTNNNWDVNSTTENYTRLNSAPATTLDFVDSGSPVYDGVSFTPNQNTSIPTGIAFNSDGTKLYISDYSTDYISQFSLSTAYDVSTATYDSVFLAVNAKESSLIAFLFSPDGSDIFVTGRASDAIHRYSLSTAWDLSTASFVNTTSIASQDTSPASMRFNGDGTKLILLGDGTDAFYQYSLSTAYDATSLTYDSVSFSMPTAEWYDFLFFNDGTKMYVIDEPSNFYEYSLSTAYDISTLSLANTYSLSAQDPDSRAIAFTANNVKLIMIGLTNDTVYQYSLPKLLTLGTGSFASADVGKTIEANDGVFVLTATDGSYVETTAPTSYDQVASGSWEMYGVVYNAADGDLELSQAAGDGFDLSVAAYTSTTLQANLVVDASFNDDGTKLYTLNQSESIAEWSLSTPYLISSATYVTAFSVSSQDTAAGGLAFKSDGTKFYFVGTNTDTVYQYSLSTAWDLSTASYDSVSFSVGSQLTAPYSIIFNNNGTTMMLVGGNNDTVYQYTLSTAWVVSSASYASLSLSVNAQDGTPRGIAFNSDGSKLFMIGLNTDAVYQYSLPTNYSLSSASYDSVSFSVGSQATQPTAIVFTPTGSKFIVPCQLTNYIYEYNSQSFFTVTGYQPVHTTASTDTTYWTDINSMTADQAAGDGNVYYAISTDDRTTWTVIDNTDGERDIVRNNAGTWQYNSNGTYASETWTNATTNTELAALAEAMEGASEATAYDIASASYDSVSFSVSSQDSAPYDIAFNADGTKMFMVGPVTDSVYEYSLSTAYNVSTASFVDTFSVTSQDTGPISLAFNSDGTKMFVFGSANDAVYEYALSTGFDLTGASYSQSFSVSAQESEPRGIAFNTDGTKLFVVGKGEDEVNEYSLSTGFDISTASYSQNFSVAAQDSQPNGITFNSDGTKMFITGETGQQIYQYNLTTGFDISTASYASILFSPSAQEASPKNVTFNSSGSKMYVIGTTGDTVFQYSVGTTTYTNQMDKTQLDAVTDPNHIALGDDLDLSIIFNMTSGTTVPSSDGVAINYDANVLNKGAVLGTDYDFDAPAQDKVRITALAGNNLKVRVV